jgi:hypothetical protein
MSFLVEYLAARPWVHFDIQFMVKLMREITTSCRERDVCSLNVCNLEVLNLDGETEPAGDFPFVLKKS